MFNWGKREDDSVAIVFPLLPQYFELKCVFLLQGEDGRDGFGVQGPKGRKASDLQTEHA